MDRPNFYILLELAVTEYDPARIQAAIRKKQGEWCTQSKNPNKELQAKKNLALIERIKRLMNDPVEREKEAREAEKILNEKEKEKFKELDETIRLLASSRGHLMEEEVAYLVKCFKGSLTEGTIRGRIKVPVRKDNGTEARSKPTIEKSLAERIAKDLQLLGKKDLYELLGCRRNTGLTALRTKALELEADARKINNKPPEITAKLQLLGHCLNLFKTESEREKYDNTLDQHRLVELNPLIEAAGATGEIQAGVMQQLLRKAEEKGVAIEEARRHIIDFARARKWSVQVPSSSTAVKLQRCGGCGILNEERAKACRVCGEALTVECPKCKAINPSENRACSNCGLSVGDVALVRRLLCDVDLALAHGELQQATLLLKEAQKYSSNSPEIETRLQALSKRQKEEKDAFEHLEACVMAQRFLEAQRLLPAFKQRVANHPDIARFEKQIATGIDAAKRHVARGRILEQSGKTDDAMDAYLEALRECKDLEEARNSLAKCPPESPRQLQATPTARAIVLRWQSSPSRGQMTYHVVRKPDSEPRAPSDGQLVAELDGTSFTDSDAVPGEVYYYGVYAERGGALSTRAAVVGPLLRVAEVQQPRATARDSCVSLDWQPPARARKIEVWRKEGSPPRRRGEGTKLPVVSLNSGSDNRLTNGASYGYRVIAVFDGVDGKPLYSEGLTITAVPIELPKPVTDLTVNPRGGHFEVTWMPPSVGQVQVFASGERCPFQFGDIVSVCDLERLGRRVPALGPRSARGKSETDALLYLTPVSVAGSTAVIGQPVPLSCVRDVDNLSVGVHDNVLLARWDWPPKIESALVALRKDRFPTGPQDPHAARETCVRFKYDRDGGFRKPLPAIDRLYVTVYAPVTQAGEELFASGATPGARKEVALKRYRTLKYKISAKSGFFGLGKTGEYVLTLTPNAATRLPELLLVGKEGGIPLDPKNGTTIKRIPAGSDCSPDRPLTVAFQPAGLAGRWRGRLFHADDEDCTWLELIEER